MNFGDFRGTDTAGVRRGRWAVGLGLGALLIPTLPNAVYFAVGENAAFWSGEWMTSVLIVTLPLLLGFSLRANLLVLLPFALFTPGALAFAWLVKVPPSVLALRLIEEAPRDEWSVFLPHLLLCGGAAVAIGLFYAGIIRLRSSAVFHLKLPGRTTGLLLLAGCLAKDVIVGHAASAPGLLAYRLEKMFPHGPLVLLARLEFDGGLRRDRSALFLHHVVRQSPPHPSNEICVLVIGEAARIRDLGLYVRGLDSTPRLQARHDLTVFRHAATCGTLTDTAVPVILTGRLPDEDGVAIADRLGLVEAFRLAGFHTAWISNQGADADSIDTLSAFAASAHEQINVNDGNALGLGAANPRHFDGALLAPLASVLRANQGRLFVVVHLIGSHQPYLQRYPADFERWPVDSAAKKSMQTWIAPFDRSQQTALNHARLNSAYYTDWVLDRILSLVAATGRSAAVAYLSDHGENLPDAPLLPAMHGTATDDVINIPFLFWFSNEFQAQEKMKIAGLTANAGKRVSSADLFATLCNLYDLQVPEDNPATNLTDPDYREHELRVVRMDNQIITVRR